MIAGTSCEGAPRLEILADAGALARRAATLVINHTPARADSIYVFPTGKTPLGLYRELVATHRRVGFGFGGVRFFALDEYAGIARDDPRRLGRWLWQVLLEPMGVPRAHVVGFDPGAPDPDLACARVDARIAARGGIDLLVLGLGENGHLGFNEPGTRFDAPSRLVELTPETRATNAAYWDDRVDVPATAYTLGPRTLLAARRVLLLVSGKRKAAILDRTLNGPIDLAVPATMLRLHPGLTVLADTDATPPPPEPRALGQNDS